VGTAHAASAGGELTLPWLAELLPALSIVDATKRLAIAVATCSALSTTAGGTAASAAAGPTPSLAAKSDAGAPSRAVPLAAAGGARSAPDAATERETLPPVLAIIAACSAAAAASCSSVYAAILLLKASASLEPCACSASCKRPRPITLIPARARLPFSPLAARRPIVASSKTPWPSCCCQSRTDSASCSERSAWCTQERFGERESEQLCAANRGVMGPNIFGGKRVHCLLATYLLPHIW
jgi:hypothetical protein